MIDIRVESRKFEQELNEMTSSLKILDSMSESKIKQILGIFIFR